MWRIFEKVEEWWLIELWTRSQDRLRLVKTTDICIDYNNQKSLIANCRNLSNGKDDYFPLGEYDTKERALEVLDEIQNLLKPQEYEIENGNGYYTKSTNISTYVYEMPKEWLYESNNIWIIWNV